MKDHSVRLSTVLSSPCLIQPYTFIADAVSQGNSHLLILHPVKYWGTGSMLRSQFSMFRLGRMKRIILRTSTWPSPEDCKPLLALTSLRSPDREGEDHGGTQGVGNHYLTCTRNYITLAFLDLTGVRSYLCLAPFSTFYMYRQWWFK